MKTNKVAPEMAEQEFDRMCDSLDIDLEVTNDEDARSLEAQRGKVVKAITSGALTIGDDGLPTLTTREGAALAFKMPTGATLLEADKAPAGQDQRRMYLLIGALTNGKFAPSKCTVKEVGVLMALTGLFMAG